MCRVTQVGKEKEVLIPESSGLSSHSPTVGLGKRPGRGVDWMKPNSLGIDPACSEPQPQPPPLSFMG